MTLHISEQGSGILTASLVLAIMIIPYAASLSAEFIKMVPNDLKEGAYSLGATHAGGGQQRDISRCRLRHILIIYPGYRPCFRRNNDSNNVDWQYE